MKTRSLLKAIKNYLNDEEGQTSTEYILLLAIVATVIFKFRNSFDQQMDNILKSVFRKVQEIVDGIN
jgi:pilus assembly protein Flp/PilA